MIADRTGPHQCSLSAVRRQDGGMEIADLLVDAFDRVRETVLGVVEGLNEEQLTARLDPDANSIAWLVWHLTRIQDDHVSDVASRTRKAGSDCQGCNRGRTELVAGCSISPRQPRLRPRRYRSCKP